MAGVNKTSLQHRCFTAGLSTEGTKKDLLARLRIYNAVGVVEANARQDHWEMRIMSRGMAIPLQVPPAWNTRFKTSGT